MEHGTVFVDNKFGRCKILFHVTSEGYAKVMQELQPELLQIQQKQDVDALCAFYDKAIAKLK